MASKKNQLEAFSGSYDQILDLFSAEFEELACGVDYWCEYLQEVVTVVALFHGFEGDLPGRYKAGGCRSPISDSEICPVCPETRDSLLISVRDGSHTPPRPAGFYDKLVQDHKERTPFHEAILAQHGLSRISCKGFWLFLCLMLCLSLLSFQLFGDSPERTHRSSSFLSGCI